MKKSILSIISFVFIFNITMIFENDSFYLPMRATFEHLGYSIYYDENITVSTKEDTSLLIINSNKDTYINYEKVLDESKPLIIEDSLYVPVSLVNTIGYSVNYNLNDASVTFTENIDESNEVEEINEIIIDEETINEN